MQDPLTGELQARLDFALGATARTDEFILGFYQSPDLAVERKRDASPVTAADRGAEELLRQLIADAYPGDAVLGEEFGDTPGSSGWRWILDPVDGTKSFIHGVPLFGTLIGLEHGDRQVLGICSFPALDETVYAARGLGAWWRIGRHEPRPARVSPVSSLSESLFCTTTIQRWATQGKQAAFQQLNAACGLVRGWGDCFGHILVATGRAELMVDPILNPWDCAALVPILEEAGGHYLDFTGQPNIHAGQGFSINAALKDEVLRILQTPG